MIYLSCLKTRDVCRGKSPSDQMDTHQSDRTEETGNSMDNHEASSMKGAL